MGMWFWRKRYVRRRVMHIANGCGQMVRCTQPICGQRRRSHSHAARPTSMKPNEVSAMARAELHDQRRGRSPAAGHWPRADDGL